MVPMFRIAFTDNVSDKWKVLEVFDTYADADAAYDGWADKMPNAWVDIQEKIGGEWLVVA